MSYFAIIPYLWLTFTRFHLTSYILTCEIQFNCMNYVYSVLWFYRLAWTELTMRYLLPIPITYFLPKQIAKHAPKRNTKGNGHLPSGRCSIGNLSTMDIWLLSADRLCYEDSVTRLSHSTTKGNSLFLTCEWDSNCWSVYTNHFVLLSPCLQPQGTCPCGCSRRAEKLHQDLRWGDINITTQHLLCEWSNCCC
jgi:hypothetical protein